MCLGLKSSQSQSTNRNETKRRTDGWTVFSEHVDFISKLCYLFICACLHFHTFHGIPAELLPTNGLQYRRLLLLMAWSIHCAVVRSGERTEQHFNADIQLCRKWGELNQIKSAPIENSTLCKILASAVTECIRRMKYTKSNANIYRFRVIYPVQSLENSKIRCSVIQIDS